MCDPRTHLPRLVCLAMSLGCTHSTPSSGHDFLMLVFSIVVCPGSFFTALILLLLSPYGWKKSTSGWSSWNPSNFFHYLQAPSSPGVLAALQISAVHTLRRRLMGWVRLGDALHRKGGFHHQNGKRWGFDHEMFDLTSQNWEFNSQELCFDQQEDGNLANFSQIGLARNMWASGPQK